MAVEGASPAKPFRWLAGSTSAPTAAEKPFRWYPRSRMGGDWKAPAEGVPGPGGVGVRAASERRGLEIGPSDPETLKTETKGQRRSV